jgi:hypothetical protein
LIAFWPLLFGALFNHPTGLFCEQIQKKDLTTTLPKWRSVALAAAAGIANENVLDDCAPEKCHGFFLS